MNRRFLPVALALGLAFILLCRPQAVRAAVDSKETIAHRAERPKLVPEGWDAALAGDIVMQRLVRVTPSHAKGAHDAEFVCVGGRAYIVEHDNDVQPDTGRGRRSTACFLLWI